MSSLGYQVTWQPFACLVHQHPYEIIFVPAHFVSIFYCFFLPRCSATWFIQRQMAWHAKKRSDHYEYHKQLIEKICTLRITQLRSASSPPRERLIIFFRYAIEQFWNCNPVRLVASWHARYATRWWCCRCFTRTLKVQLGSCLRMVLC